MSNQLGLLVPPDGDDRRSCRPHPLPERARVIYDPTNHQTVVARFWAEGEAERCKLCPRGTCIAEDGFCMLLIPGRVKREDAATASTLGIPRLRPPH